MTTHRFPARPYVPPRALSAAFVALACLTLHASAAHAAGYAYSRAITINHTKAGTSNLSNFPMLFSGTYGFLKTVANGGNAANANGYDIGFFSDSSCATKLDWETETYDGATGTVNYWIRIPALSFTTDVVIYLCYGNASITTDQSHPAGVWDSSYLGVYHLPNGTVLTTKDSTSNANDLVNAGGTAETGQIGGGGAYAGASTAHSSAVPVMTGGWTVTAWVHQDASVNSSTYATALGFSSDSSHRVDLGYNNQRFKVVTNAETPGTGNAFTNGTRYLVYLEWNGSQFLVYENGVYDYSVTPTGSLWQSSNTFYINDPNAGSPMTGGVDEVRVSNTVRTVSWMLATYNNESSPGTFYSVGPETATVTPLSLVRFLGGFFRIVGGSFRIQ